jgi:acetyl esterase
MRINIKLSALILAFTLFSFTLDAQSKSDLIYGIADGEELKLDLSVPNGTGLFPVCILVHGGSFVTGDKQKQVKPLFEPLNKAGYAWVSINYRLAPLHKYPCSVEDVETSVRWVKQHASEYHFDPNRIVLIGESAGAYLVSMVGERNKAETQVAAVVFFYGSSNFVDKLEMAKGKTDKILENYFGITADTPAARQLLIEASPVTYVKPGLPPFLLFHGDEDARVPYKQSVNFYEKLNANKVPAEFITIKGGGHGMGGWSKLGSDYITQLITWLNKTVKP